MSECGYSHSDDFYNEITCSLPEGHDGPHRATYEWDTCPADICLVKGHEWNEWEPIAAKAKDISDLLMRHGLLALPPIKEPTKQRVCERCGRWEDDGKYPASGLFPILTPLRSNIPRVPSSVKITYTR